MPTLPFSLPQTLSDLPLPGITAVADNTDALVTLTCTSLSGYTTLTITRYNTVTGAFATVRDADATAISGVDTMVFFDYEAPLNQPVYYVLAVDTLPLATSDTVEIVVTGGIYWIKNITQEAVSTKVHVSSITSVTRKARTLARYDVLGSPYPIVVSDVRGSRTGHMKLYCLDTSETTALVSLLADGATLFFQAPGAANFPDMYFIAGDVSETWEGLSTDPTKTFEFDFEEVASPTTALTSLGFNSWLTVTSFSTWQNVLDKRLTWLAVLNAPYTPSDAP